MEIDGLRIFYTCICCKRIGQQGIPPVRFFPVKVYPSNEISKADYVHLYIYYDQKCTNCISTCKDRICRPESKKPKDFYFKYNARMRDF